MAVLNSDHLIDQATLLMNATPGRKPRQVNLRRAISAAYYAVFHRILTSAADEFVGKALRRDSRHALVYRSIDHSAARRVCEEASRPNLTPRYRKVVGVSGFESNIRAFSNIFLKLQNQRHEADYDPSQQFTSVDAMFSIYLAKSALEEFSACSAEGKKLFLTLMVFPPR